MIYVKQYGISLSPAKDEIEVKAVMTGICSSDVAMYKGTFTTLPTDIPRT